ncbi:hypothetical protein OpiT1DRAFT_00496 [Opitutaceae bacterium TAV1]|nr:hypothetical protein OPIT5_18860 [Opitutaceae bacterium TAV5]EIQ01920.1 hypothetical protein OpiT1DRAFT_00496 [Opitutaceae bacterium TAV1]
MHRFIPDPASPPPRLPDPGHAAAIRRWTRDYLRLADDVAVIVNELPCLDPGCPLVQTSIAVFETAPARTRHWTFTRPAVAVTRAMVQQTLATPPLPRA